jgi:hypothetical protein
MPCWFQLQMGVGRARCYSGARSSRPARGILAILPIRRIRTAVLLVLRRLSVEAARMVVSVVDGSPGFEGRDGGVTVTAVLGRDRLLHGGKAPYPSAFTLSHALLALLPQRPAAPAPGRDRGRGWRQCVESVRRTVRHVSQAPWTTTRSGSSPARSINRRTSFASAIPAALARQGAQYFCPFCLRSHRKDSVECVACAHARESSPSPPRGATG